MGLRKFQRLHTTFPFSSETAASLSSRPGFGEQCLHHQLYGEFDLYIVCCDGEAGLHQAVLGHASKMVKEILLGDTMLLGNGDVLNVVNSKKEERTMILPDIKKSTVKNLISVLYTGDVVMTSLEEAGELKALWRLLKIDLIHIKDLQILFETDSSNSKLDKCGTNSNDTSEEKTQDVNVNRRRSPKWKRPRHSLHRTKRGPHPPRHKQKSPRKTKLLKLFEKILAQTLKTKFSQVICNEEMKQETTVLNVEQADSRPMITTTSDEKKDNFITVASTETTQSRSTIMHPTTPIITQNTLSYEDQNFSYDIDLLSTDIIEQDSLYHQPQGTIYQAPNSIFQSQNHNVCIPVIQEETVPLQLPLSYMQRPSIFVPVSFQEPAAVSEPVSSTFSFLSSPTQVITPDPKSLNQGIKHRRVNLKRKHEEIQKMDDTDGLALQPNLQNDEHVDVLDSFKNLIPFSHFEEDVNQIVPQKSKNHFPKFRENNNWIGKKHKQEVIYEERPRQKVKLKISFCKKINFIKDIPTNRRRQKLTDKNEDNSDDRIGALSNGDLTSEEQVADENNPYNGYNDVKRPLVSKIDSITFQHNIRCDKNPNLGNALKDKEKPKSTGELWWKTIFKESNAEPKSVKTSFKEKEKTKINGKSDINSKSPKKKIMDFEEQKYEMDAKLIESYFRNQTKLKVINKWKIEPFINLYDKSNDKKLKRQNNIRTSMVDLPNVLESVEGKFYYPQEEKCQTKKKSTCLMQARKISKMSALAVAKQIKTKDVNPLLNSDYVVSHLLDTLITDAVLDNTRNLCSLTRRDAFVTDILDNIISSVVCRTSLQPSKRFK
jgi:hypothetical protein